MGRSIYIAKIIHDTAVDGAGLRTAVYCTGCAHRCENCQNSALWNMYGGKLLSVYDIYDEFMSNPLNEITFTGGDPMYQAEGFYWLAKLIKEKSDKTIWCYTGFTFEAIIREGGYKLKLLQETDVLVDGRYIEKLKSKSAPYRGSTNQRVIDAVKSLKCGSVIELNL